MDDEAVSGISQKNNNDLQNLSEEEEINEAFPDYPLYPPSEDIYSNYAKEEEVDIEHPYTSNKSADNNPITSTEKGEDFTGNGLDVPGSELDDEQEYIGSEDEENNYYSLGGDRHENLDEFSDDNV
jgi:restriction endonuclease S subunit